VTRRTPRRRLGAAVAGAGLLASLAAMPPLSDGTMPVVADRVSESALVAPPASSSLPLAGVRIALDPGHQLGNHNFPTQIRRLVPAGGFRKACNTTGTATNGGFPEATLNFRVARLVRTRLEALGAEVFLTRTRNSESLWGPCVDARGEFGAKVNARLTVSLHGDGARAGARGFHVIAPTSRSPWTTDIARPSRRLARALRAGFDALGIPRSTYVGNGTALSIRSDLATLNMSDVPVAMIEVGNMRNSSDAHRMTTRKGRIRYARAVVRGIRLYLAR
jgi:N-acetylmuramoyl-L-alanine amidase